LTTQQIIDILEQEYQIHAYRTTVAQDIEVLQSLGLDIQVVKSSQNLYNVLGRYLDSAELKLLIDAVASSKFISKKKSEELVRKIAALAGKYEAENLRRNISVERQIKGDNENLVNITDAINTAINLGKQISFQYFEYNARKEKKLRFDGYWYKFSPHRLVWNGDYYYMVGYYAKYETVRSFRIDRIASVPRILDDDALPLPGKFDLDHYLNTMYHMFSTERQTVELVCGNDMMGALIDRFGEDVTTYAYDMENFKAEVEVAVNNIFFTWVAGFGGKVKIKAPEDVKQGYREMLKAAEDGVE